MNNCVSRDSIFMLLAINFPLFYNQLQNERKKVKYLSWGKNGRTHEKRLFLVVRVTGENTKPLYYCGFSV